MPKMQNGEFWGIDEVRGNLRFAENLAAAIRGNGFSDEDMPANAKGILKKLDAEAASLRTVVEEYEARILQ